MHLINFSKKETFKIILDEPRVYLRESSGSVMVRGEVIVHFLKDTYIQGPIEVVFECIQRIYPWAEIMAGSALKSSTIEEKLQVIELSLPPPTSTGLMPAGIQRFPFEFPIPTSLPTTLHIKDRMDIFYQIHATLRRTSSATHDLYSSRAQSSNKSSLIKWPHSNTLKTTYTSTAPMRIVRAMESTLNPPEPGVSPAMAVPGLESPRSSIDTASFANSVIPQNRNSLALTLDPYAGNLDEQHDALAFSLAGRSLGNLTQPIQCLSPYEGIRYKIGIDRTAIALGSTIGVDVMIHPMYENAVVKSIVLKVSEDRTYNGLPARGTKPFLEQRKIVMKWAYDDGTSDGYIRTCTSELADMYPEYMDYSNICDISKRLAYMEDFSSSGGGGGGSSSSCFSGGKLINLKEELNQPVLLGEYFHGRFAMPVPDCSTSILNPSMDYKSVKIKHWLQLLVTVECNGKTLELSLQTPGQVLDCRLVNDDENGNQTFIPPPPAYQPSVQTLTKSNTTFWEQRQPITLASGWGSCVPCPCEAKKLKSAKKNTVHSPSYLHKWGPPPSYSA